MKKHQFILLTLCSLLGIAFFSFFGLTSLDNEELLRFGPPPTAEFKRDLKSLTQQVQGKLVFERTYKDRSRARDIYTMQLGDNKPQLIAKDGRRPKWSPDGRRVLFLRSNDVVVVDSDGQNEMRVATSGHADCAAWFPSGEEIAFTDLEEVDAVHLGTGEVRKLLPENDPFREIDISHDGRFLLGCLKRGGGFTIRRFDLATHEVEVLGKGCSPSFSPDSKHITNLRHRHVELFIRDTLSGEQVRTVTAPADYRFDNQVWSNHPDYMTSVIEGPINEIFIHQVWDDTKTQVTAMGDCDHPDLFVK